MLPEPPVVNEEWLSDYDHLGFDGRPHRHRVGNRALDPSAWLEPDSRREAQLALKHELVSSTPELVTLEPIGDAAARGAQLLEDRLSEVGVPTDPSSSPCAIVRCGLATQEDWCVMVREDTWRLGAASVCFPSRWVLSEKAGGTIASIHDPVPGYAQQLDGVVERVLDRLAPQRAVWRTNWNIWDDARLFQPRQDAGASTWELPTPDQVGRRLVLRTERQTLTRLSDDVVAFGIRVHQRRLESVLHQPGALDLLASTIDGLGESASAHKKLGRLEPAIRGWVHDSLATASR